ncbi:hypothetical protein SAMN05216386_0836 [Nitrosospira briensis]|uniref:Uncharacterized protein n=1 Tax=Nitrosospira briensis TaxID=35799 RepID=A0A1I4YQR4_9PROT|nr:DUF6345 domain-containing protein [Nitrosospira briensis]SFN40352.1 hypothetical protein SAMN05216386_0836 [Nitrosospira briensis]
MKLPIFPVASTVAPAEHIHDLGKLLFPRADYEMLERGTRIELTSKSGSIEIDVARGGVWAADLSRLWRFAGVNSKKRELISAADAERSSYGLLTKYGVLPQLTGPFRLKTRTSGTTTVIATKNMMDRQVFQEDITILMDVEIDVSEFGVGGKVLPLVGGGGRFGVAFGEGGRLLGLRGVWRPVTGEPELQEVVEQTKADQTFRAMTASMKIAEFSSELAYFAAPAFSEQNLLYPVYVYSAVADFEGNRVPLRKIIIPATEVTVPASQPLQPTRTQNARPFIRPLPADFQPVPGRPLPPGIAINRRLLRQAGLKFTDVFTIESLNGPLILNPNFPVIKLKELGNLLGFYSAGTSWIGLSGGLAGSQNNAQGFVDELAAAGWSIRFNWGDANAWESDWREFNDEWVDAVDFVFYTGHANSDGWVFAAPDDTFLHFTETAGAPDLWGTKNLEWAVVAACGPLQDDVVGSGGNVLERWRNAFDGLHILMGYGQVTFDNEEEGQRLAQYAKAGSTIIQSWFRTAQEIQPGEIWAGAYYLGDATGSTESDHLWGTGSVGPDVTNPTWRACSWVPC